MLTKEQLEHFREKLTATKADLEKQIKELGMAPDFGHDTDHFEEAADEVEQYSTNLGIAQALRERLENVNHALEKIAAGIYGKCENCKEKDVDPKILEVNPEFRFCKNCE